MKFRNGAAVVAFVGMLAVCVAGCGGSSASSGSPTPTRLLIAVTSTRTPVPVTTDPRSSAAFFCGQKTCVPTAPTATAPPSCGFGSGIWEQCAKTAVDPAFADLSARYNFPRGTELAVFIEERIDWPDSCLGVDTPGVVCLQVITPGFRFVLTGPPGTPYADYHTDLNGHELFVAEYATYQDVPPTHTPH